MNVKRPSHGVVVAYLALFVAMTGTATAATGGSFILGKGNSASTTTTLSNSNGVPLSLNSRSGSAPLKVGSSTKVSNLNVDKLDGLDSTQFQRALSGSCNFGIASLTAAGYKTCATGDATTLDGLDSTLFLKVGDPLTVGPRGFQGDQGPAGPQGDKGDQGLTGLTGPSNGYFVSAAESAHSNETRTIVSIDAPEGSYVVFAVAKYRKNNQEQKVSCNVLLDGAQVIASGVQYIDSQFNSTGTITIQGAGALPSSGTISFQCESFGGQGTVSGSMSAIRVGTVAVTSNP
jgi:hypothetical protein